MCIITTRSMIDEVQDYAMKNPVNQHKTTTDIMHLCRKIEISLLIFFKKKKIYFLDINSVIEDMDRPTAMFYLRKRFYKESLKGFSLK